MKRKTLAIILVLCLVISIPAFGASYAKKITAYINQVKIMVNGQQLPKDTLIYNNKVYVNASDMAKTLKISYKWDKKANKVVFTDKVVSGVATKGYERTTPADLNDKLTLTYGYSNEYKAEASVSQIIRGESAYSLVLESNQYADPPPENYEYLLAKINFKLISAVDQYGLSGLDFHIVSSQGKVSEIVSQFVPSPTLEADLYAGAENEGWAVFIVEINDSKPVLAFGRDYKGAGGIWFKAY